ncbi:MAG: hypothetical protein M1821_002391 [Bathelium mastoideum]|nr:MAG: hypothetical protein M1821_002391 [Bathelium mastoideum]KAI9686399.1 MAG: hypothetical protein M1822_003744 [Bathelium mastoideum]
MAPATSANSSFPASSATANNWTDFFNTVGTAVAPIITLFGEQATKQFLSMSMGWADNILLSTGSIGILTVVVSAIRVAGYRWFKAIIGRARESRVTAEQEFLSSTSVEVCELWSGSEIVRVAGKPSEHNDMKDLVILQSNKSQSGTAFEGVTDVAGASASGLLDVQPKPIFQRYGSTIEEIKKIALEAPNLALNVPGVIINPKEL